MENHYLTADLPGIGGQLKLTPEDFFVEEIPRYRPSGEGQHVYAVIEKRGLSTYAAMRRIATALKIHPRAIGCAGLKDAHAVTRQTLSINQVSPEAVAALDIPNVKILSVDRHRNKLKTGHLTGNRFVIRVRDVNREALATAEKVVARLAEKGVPNFFGKQRFGVRNNTDRLGEALIRQDPASFVAEYLGNPQDYESPHIQTARALVDQQQWEAAFNSWPGELVDEKAALAEIIKRDGQIETVFKIINKRMKSLFVSAFQSRLFNRLLVQRLHSFDQLENGDVAYIHGKGAAFLVTDAAVEQPRADRFEISPSGPLFGPKTLLAKGEPGRRETAVLAEYQLEPEEIKVPGMKIRGTRRPYRFPLKEPKLWWDEGLMVSFELPSGAYATTVMGELMKND